MNVRRTSTPARVITLAEAKSQLNVLTTRDDDYITSLISVAEETIMARTNTVFSAATFKISMQGVSGQVRLPRYPVYNTEASPIVITAVKEQGDDVTTLVEGTDWEFIEADTAVCFLNNEFFYSIEITTEVGFTSEDFPVGLKGATLMFIGELYANRQSSMGNVVEAIPYGIDFMLAAESYDYCA